jgi:hypothetical protein
MIRQADKLLAINKEKENKMEKNSYGLIRELLENLLNYGEPESDLFRVIELYGFQEKEIKHLFRISKNK